jgi:hypothetical protein
MEEYQAFLMSFDLVLPRWFYANPYAATRLKDDIEDVLLLSV